MRWSARSSSAWPTRPARAFDPTDLLGTGTFSAQLVPQGALGTDVVADLDVKTLGIARPSIDLTGVAPGPATLRMTLRLTTARVSAKVPGTALEPAVVDLPVEILPPRGVPPLPRLIDFGTITGPVETTAGLDRHRPRVRLAVRRPGDHRAAGRRRAAVRVLGHRGRHLPAGRGRPACRTCRSL